MNKDYILSIFFIFFKKPEISAIVWYGNKKGNDTDLFVVLKGDYGIFTYQTFFLDIVFVGENIAEEYAKCLDPLITEPILTGEVIYGNVEILYYTLLGVENGNFVSKHLLESAHRYYGLAVIESWNGLDKEAVVTLSFVQSFVLYAIEYMKGKELVIFKDILSGDYGHHIVQMRKRFKDCIPISDIEMSHFFKQSRKMLTDMSLIVNY